MKRPAASDSIITPFFSSEERGEMVLEEEDDDDEICCAAEGGGVGGGLKKRRLGTEQVRALERCFEIENKLDPERKARLAQDLGLQPRQVAVWFQNRRARWKTKQLERDFAALKSRYDALRVDFDSLRRDNHSLLAELADLKSKLGPVNAVDNELVVAAAKLEEEKMEVVRPFPPAVMAGDGSSDSDSSVVLTDDNRLEGGIVYQAQQMFKMEEHSFFGGEEPCSASFFSDEHVPTLAWFCTDLTGGW
ncbi:hypothetical protein M5K25_020140 [Dendrobium thyrsiflorum]|uniref:Homeobox-leucine zipper protein n=1 Tax=Dendrobium thyrsiflorum TaxID=117978 RepID=A0ABD0U942_DENTH